MAIQNELSTMSDLGSALNKILLEKIHPVFDQRATMWKWFPKKGQEFGETTGFLIPIEDSFNRGLGASAENGNLPPLGESSPTHFLLATKFLFGGLSLSLQSTIGTKSKKSAIVRNVQYQMKALQEAVIKDMNRVVFKKAGELGEIASSTGSTITMKTPDFDRYLKPGDFIAIHTNDGAIRTGYQFTIQSIDRATHIVTLDTTCDAADDADIVYRANMGDDESSQTYWPAGLGHIVDDRSYASATFQGKTRDANNPQWEGNVLDNSAVDRDLTTLLMDRAWDKTMENSTYDAPDLMVWAPATKRTWHELLLPDTRWVPGKTMDPGAMKAAYNGTEIIVDNDCNRGQIYFLRKETLSWYQQAPLQFWNLGNVLQRMDSGSTPKANVYARCYLFGNFGSNCPSANTRITDLNHTL